MRQTRDENAPSLTAADAKISDNGPERANEGRNLPQRLMEDAPRRNGHLSRWSDYYQLGDIHE
jgi:hypothetical protein